ncbi:hypothetical protein [Phormidium sp. CCY1219]|nr:hypothetical protein [Phormidium sp. CCY1219]MEB3831562.1 hypothetical protein [Phormidium sp. CCY1219]
MGYSPIDELRGVTHPTVGGSIAESGAISLWGESVCDFDRGGGCLRSH